jgi:hypothetical protein
MRLDELRLVARRAAGEYAVEPVCRKLWQQHRRRKHRTIYIDFLNVVFATKRDWTAYERLQQLILAEWQGNPWTGEREVPEKPNAWKGELRSALESFQRGKSARIA